ncbi:uncharacterized protein LOC135589007 [Musa acuminata AAA Group]|uniref:uncharacterized protein LOC135589007 n=1 Tax=Musa acuminata AAA Group TaxID=214697 RepID=UPI0031DDA092
MSRAPPSDADKGSPGDYELEEDSLQKLVNCENRCRELQDQISSLEREVLSLEDRLEKRRYGARLSDVALDKCISAWNDLEMEKKFWVDTYGKSPRTWYKVDDDIDALRAEVGSLKDSRQALWTNVRQIQEEVKKCNEENRRLLKQLSKRRDGKGSEAEHNSSADKKWSWNNRRPASPHPPPPPLCDNGGSAVLVWQVP